MSNFLVRLGKVGYFVLPLLIIVYLLLNWIQGVLFTPLNLAATDKIPFIVNKDSNLKIISQDLADRHITTKGFSVYYLKFFKAGGDTILAGEYELSASMSPSQIFDHLVSKKIISHPITIPEGVNLNQIPGIIAKSGLVSEVEVKQALFNRALLQKLDLTGGTPEGWLFPETYNLSRPATAESIVTRIISEGKVRIDTDLKGWRDRATEIKLSPQQIMILASIIEAEAKKPNERALISSVYHNRLRLDMPLQSDPTVIYGILDFKGNLTKENLKTPGPYNTYLNSGLPPSPICNPGIESIKAALYPDDTDYIYFVSKGDGSHFFSATYKEHQQAVNNFQKIAR